MEVYSKSTIGASVTRRVSSVHLDTLALLLLSGLIITLPIAHTTSLRAFFLLGAAAVWMFKMWLERRWVRTQTPLDLPLLLFLITILLSFPFSLKLSTSISELRGEFLTQALLFYTIVNCVREERRVKTLLTVLISASLLMTLYGIADFFLQGGELFTYEYRLGSLHQGSEAYAQYLITVLPFNILGFFYFRERKERIVLCVVALVNCFGLYLTHIRAAWAAFGVEWLLIALTAGSSKRLKVIMVLTIAGVAFGMVGVLPSATLWHGTKGISFKEEEMDLNTLNLRLVMWKAAFEDLAKNPFKAAGYGKGNFRRRFEGRPFADFEQAHNTFVNTAIQLGIQGLFALLFIISTVLRNSWKGWKLKSSGFSAYYHLGVFVMTVGFFTANLFAEFYIDDTALLFWVLVGLSVSLLVRADESPQRGGSRRDVAK